MLNPAHNLMIAIPLLPTLLLRQEGGDGSGETGAPIDAAALSDTGPNPVTLLRERIPAEIDFLNRADTVTDVLAQISIVWAAIFVLVGVACIFNGYRWHKWVITALAAMAGAWIGYGFGDEIGEPPVVAACLAVLCAVVAWPMMRYSAALFGGLAGAFVGANLWSALGQDPDNHRLGALMGLVVFGMLAFLSFRTVVIALTTVVGGSLLTIGAAAALMRVDSWSGGIEQSLRDQPLMFPLLTGVATLIGMVVQFGGGIKGMNELANKADGKAAPAQKKAA